MQLSTTCVRLSDIRKGRRPARVFSPSCEESHCSSSGFDSASLHSEMVVHPGRITRLGSNCPAYLYRRITLLRLLYPPQLSHSSSVLHKALSAASLRSRDSAPRR
ncbi:hypothetical protein ANCCAN_30088 [Ancylostoma caninum]|uniref:Uncharacterized protein n=1 Tax=Ancylostoma caninum TaxID=29170 RepID=A0A368EWU1_ANCCA|nr:hypothetical protein ANCCAN_30088 [Ancylostoma caninum]